MNILIGTILLAIGAATMLRHLSRTQPDALPDIFTRTKQTTTFMVPRIFAGLIGAGFLAALLPVDQVERFFGESAGVTGVLFATLLGALTPGGPFVAFAIGASALKAGAALAPLMAYVTAWCIFNFNRALAYEMSFMGRRFTAIRHIVSLPVPIILGCLLLVI
ncbi:hypothetical protein [Actibacterium mucosum]|uniref:hypothetical protein n=1 Tax=Actibacterium mucosum TaxID=1087332 RepID=UPI0009DF3002|nr:hypothetical protein [Actibacterium mucosum]